MGTCAGGFVIGGSAFVTGGTGFAVVVVLVVLGTVVEEMATGSEMSSSRPIIIMGGVVSSTVTLSTGPDSGLMLMGISSVKFLLMLGKVVVGTSDDGMIVGGTD